MRRHPTSRQPGGVAGRVTPMMEQYVEIRAANPDCLLFYRMGDFYELFFDDAVIASRALGITLTKRGKHLGDDIPMCGVPVHAADDYLQKLIALGHRVAVCEQTEDPAEARKRGGKSVVRRAVTRLVTPGTITEERLLDSGRNNYLAALVRIAGSDGADRHALAWIDISTGEFRIAECAAGRAAGVRCRGSSRARCWSLDRLAEDAEIRNAGRRHRRGADAAAGGVLRRGAAEERLCAALRREDDGGVREFQPGRAFGRRGAHRLCREDADRQAPADRAAEAARRRRDDADRRGHAGQSRDSFARRPAGARGRLFAAIDRTQSAAGARLLAERLASPLSDPAQIEKRLDAVEFFLDRPELRGGVRAALAARAGHAAGALAARARARRPARPRHDPRRPRKRRATIAVRLATGEPGRTRG